MATSTTKGTPASPGGKPVPPKEQLEIVDKKGEIGGDFLDKSSSGGSSPAGAASEAKEAATAGSGSKAEKFEERQKDDAGEAEKKKTSGVKSLLAGGFGGVCAVLTGQPFDLTKTRLQTAKPGQYSGALDVVKQTMAKDGVRGFYRGMSSPLVGVTPMFAVSFWGYAMGKQIVYQLTPNRTDPGFTNSELAFAGAFSAVPTTLVATPVERVKVLLQVEGQGANPKYTGPVDVISKLYKEGGIKSIYRGTGATLARDGPGSAAYFIAYELVKKAMTPAGGQPDQLNLGATIMAGGVAGMAMWGIAIPPDTIKSRLQGAAEGTYKGFLDCAVQTVKADGPSALFKGFGPAMLRAFPANAATFVGFEYAMKAMNSLW